PSEDDSNELPPAIASEVPRDEEVESTPELVATPPGEVAADQAPDVLTVIASVRNHFPLVQEAQAGRMVASGEALSASGAFDRRLDGYSNAQPLDYYENNWHKWSLSRNTMWGGEVGAGYRLGRG